MSLDETSLYNGELYIIVTNKAGKGKRRTIELMSAGTKAEEYSNNKEIALHLWKASQEMTNVIYLDNNMYGKIDGFTN